jgi:hypothetical protein
MTDSNDEATTTQRRPLLRKLLLLPPAFLIVAAVVCLLASPFAWGAAEVIDAPDWAPVATGLLLAIGPLIIGRFALRKTLRDTRGDFDVFGLHVAGGFVMFVSGGLMLFSLVVRLPDSATYAQAINDEGEQTVSTWGFFLLSLVLGAFNVGWVWVGAYLYSHAVSNQQPNRISARTPGEVDGVGELLRERR